MARRCTCAGNPDRICVWCARKIEEADAAIGQYDPDGWMVGQDRYERWLGEIAP
jgi:hypothetical protein